MIPQIDGIYDINSNIEKFSQTEEINNKKVEVQTESITDSLALVLIGEIAENWEDEYLGETFWNLPEGFYYNSWFTDSVRSIHQTSSIPKEYTHMQRQSHFLKLCRGKSSAEVN